MCSSSISNLAYKCNYCGSSFCQDHRIPENHDCVGLKLVKQNDDQWGLGMLDVDSKPSKNVNIKQAIDVIKEQQTLQSVEKAPSPNSDADSQTEESSVQEKTTGDQTDRSKT